MELYFRPACLELGELLATVLLQQNTTWLFTYLWRGGTQSVVISTPLDETTLKLSEQSQSTSKWWSGRRFSATTINPAIPFAM